MNSSLNKTSNTSRPFRRYLRFALWCAAIFAVAGGLGHAENGDVHDHGHYDRVPDRPGFDFSDWESIPIQEGGLEKAFLAFSRDFTKEVTGKVDFGGRHPIENYLSMSFETQAWRNENFLKLRHEKLKKTIGVKGGRISPETLNENFSKFKALIDGPDGGAINKELGQLFHRMDRIRGRLNEDQTEVLVPPASDLMRIVPVRDYRGESETWRTPDELVFSVKDKTPAQERVVAALSTAREAFLHRDAATFNRASAELASAVSDLDPRPDSPARMFKLSSWDAKMGLFRVAGWIYLVSALVFLTSYLAGKKLFSLLAGSLLGLGSGVHLVALIIRGILAGRTPVANLFESAVFIIGVITILSLIISIYYRTRVVGLGGATLGAFFMGIANNLPLHFGGKIQPLIAALQSYWLNIHVTSMLISYAFFSVAFFVAFTYLLRMAVMRRRPGFDVATDPILRYLDSLNFRIITIGVPVLTGGIILGAVWAAEAWGRPWAFDPKETAAAITFMIYALYLHARLFLGWRGPRGIWLSVLGYAAVIFTYLGVSFFLPGLHSYVSEEGFSFTQFIKNLIPGI